MLFFEEAGSGVPLVMLHPFPLSSQALWPQLANPIDGVRLIAPDLRGFGKSGPGAGTLTMDSMADDVLALLDALELPSAFIGGISMGGYVAIALTRRDPGRVRGLVLVDTQSTADDEAGKANREKTAQEIEAKGMAYLVETLLPKLLSPHASAEVFERVKGLLLETSPATAAAATRGMSQRVDGKDILPRLGVPTLVVVGDGDVITPLAKAKLMADLVSGAQLEVIAGAGHLSNLDQPAAFNAVLTRFFELRVAGHGIAVD